MPKPLRILLLSLGGAGIFFAGLFVYSGILTNVVVQEVIWGPHTLVFEHRVGDYAETGKSVESLINFSMEKQINPKFAYKTYYDDPNKKPLNELRSDAGIGIDSADLEKIDPKFQRAELPRGKYLLAEFPQKNWISIFIGAVKSYGALLQEAQARKIENPAVMEVYSLPSAVDKKTQYLIKI